MVFSLVGLAPPGASARSLQLVLTGITSTCPQFQSFIGKSEEGPTVHRAGSAAFMPASVRKGRRKSVARGSSRGVLHRLYGPSSDCLAEFFAGAVADAAVHENAAAIGVAASVATAREQVTSCPST